MKIFQTIENFGSAEFVIAGRNSAIIQNFQYGCNMNKTWPFLSESVVFQPATYYCMR